MAGQAKRDYLDSINTKPQTKINGFFEFTNAITDLANKRLTRDLSLSYSDFLGLTSEDLLTLLELQSDVDLRNAL